MNSRCADIICNGGTVDVVGVVIFTTILVVAALVGGLLAWLKKR